jgi:hypothetical protein
MNKQDKKKNKEKKPIQLMRERYGGVSEDLKLKTRSQTHILKSIRDSLKITFRTVPELSDILKMPTHDVLWYIMALKKYGEVIEGEERDGYYEYRLKEEEQIT